MCVAVVTVVVALLTPQFSMNMRSRSIRYRSSWYLNTQTDGIEVEDLFLSLFFSFFSKLPSTIKQTDASCIGRLLENVLASHAILLIIPFSLHLRYFSLSNYCIRFFFYRKKKINTAFEQTLTIRAGNWRTIAQTHTQIHLFRET